MLASLKPKQEERQEAKDPEEASETAKFEASEDESLENKKKKNLPSGK